MNSSSLSNNLRNTMKSEFAKSGIYNQGIEGLKTSDEFIKSLPQNEEINVENPIIRNTMKKSNTKNLVSKTKMNKPIGKITSIGKTESKEATASGGSGQYSQPLFSEPKNKTKKVETKEATGASSSGQYSGPKIWAKSTSKKDWKGASKTQIPGGKFVQVKKKCKTFPYCNQGDIKALKIFESEDFKKAITNVSKKYNVSENIVKNIVAFELGYII